MTERDRISIDQRLNLARGTRPAKQSWDGLFYPYRILTDGEGGMIVHLPIAGGPRSWEDSLNETGELFNAVDAEIQREADGSPVRARTVITEQIAYFEKLIREIAPEAELHLARIRASLVDFYRECQAVLLEAEMDDEVESVRSRLDWLWLSICHATASGWGQVETELRAIAEEHRIPSQSAETIIGDLRIDFQQLRGVQRDLYHYDRRYERLQHLRRASGAITQTRAPEAPVNAGAPPIDPYLSPEGDRWRWTGNASELATVVYVAPCGHPPGQDYVKRRQYFEKFVDFDNWDGVVQACKQLRSRAPSLPEDRVKRICRDLAKITGYEDR